MSDYKFLNTSQNGHSETASHCNPHTQQHLGFQKQGPAIPFSTHQHSIENKAPPNPCQLDWTDVRDQSGTRHARDSSFKMWSQYHSAAENLFHPESAKALKPNLPPLPPPPLPPPSLHPVGHPPLSIPPVICPPRHPITSSQRHASPHSLCSTIQNNLGVEIESGIFHPPLPPHQQPAERANQAPIQDEELIHSWVSKVKKRLSKREDETLKISNIQKKLLLYATLVSKLEKIVEEFSHESKDHIWNTLFEKSEHMKHEISHLNTYFNEERNQMIKDMIIRQREKRVKSRKLKKIKAGRRQSRKEKWKQRELEIDHQLKQQYEEEKNKIIEEKVKKEADIILREVRSKQEDLHKMQKLLLALSELRNARLKKGEVHGYVTSAPADAFFSKAQREFGELLPSQLRLYQEEEQALKVMMEESKNPLLHSTTKRLAFRAPKMDKLKEDLHEILFGPKNPLQSTNEFYKSFTASDESVEILINRRHSWDQFLVKPDDVMGSSVPIGWVVPNIQPNFKWRRYQHQ